MSNELLTIYLRGGKMRRVSPGLPVFFQPPLWSSGQSSGQQIQMLRFRFPALQDILGSCGSGTGFTQSCEDNCGATWKTQ
jgi:hypothetical protein